MKGLRKNCLAIVLAIIGFGCSEPVGLNEVDAADQQADDFPEQDDPGEAIDREETSDTATSREMCSGNLISAVAVEEMLLLTEVTDKEDIYSIYDRIDGISTLFEACEDPWGLFPLTYRHITARGIRAIENGEFEDPDWRKWMENAGTTLPRVKAKRDKLGVTEHMQDLIMDRWKAVQELARYHLSNMLDLHGKLD